MKYLLDTCVISELVKQTPNVKVLDWLGRQSSDSLYVSWNVCRPHIAGRQGCFYGMGTHLRRWGESR